jgi:hypothetical protein
MTITMLERSSSLQVTGGSPGHVVVFETQVLDARTLVTSTHARTTTFDATTLPEAPARWVDILHSSQRTSLSFLEDEPDLYDDEDGEPV